MGREDEIKLIAIWEQRGKSGAAASEGTARAPKKAPGRTAKAEATGKTSRKTRS